MELRPWGFGGGAGKSVTGGQSSSEIFLWKLFIKLQGDIHTNIMQCENMVKLNVQCL